ncbi:MAG: hypothetical protein JXR88_00665 [Clostridia bacterium]|nr:hypothetical protein [Clostridia bacterium]
MKKITILIMIGILALNMISCSSNEDVASTTVNEVSVVTETDTAEKVVPDRKAEISGVVKNIVGNEVTISLIEKETTGTQDQSSTEELTEEEKAEKQAANQASKGSNSSSGTGMTDVALSGETVDIIIPVGTSVVKSDGTGELAELNIGDIFKGDTVKVWILEGGEDSVQIAEFVQVLDQ